MDVVGIVAEVSDSLKPPEWWKIKVWRYGQDLFGSEWGLVVVICKQCNETFGFMKGR